MVNEEIRAEIDKVDDSTPLTLALTKKVIGYGQQAYVAALPQLIDAIHRLEQRVIDLEKR